jgi:uncharacterized protein
MLEDFFKKYRKAAIAFSGGVDSSYLFYAAVKSSADVCAYYVKTEFQPEFELRDAEKFARQIKGRLKILRHSILDNSKVLDNSPLRCYHCKSIIMGLIIRQGTEDGYETVLDGSNASDMENDRPGMKAAGELGILSPLREKGLTKQDIRRLSREAGLFTWDKPSYSCLATRIPTGTPITTGLLGKIDRSEGRLFELGFTDFRARLKNSNSALLQFPAPQLEKAKKMWDTIKNQLSSEFDSIELDPNPRP